MQVFSFQNSTIYIFLMKAIYFHIQKKGRKWKENRKLIFQRREPHKNIHTRIDRLINSLACISISYSKFSSDVSFRANKSHFPFLLPPPIVTSTRNYEFASRGSAKLNRNGRLGEAASKIHPSFLLSSADTCVAPEGGTGRGGFRFSPPVKVGEIKRAER